MTNDPTIITLVCLVCFVLFYSLLCCTVGLLYSLKSVYCVTMYTVSRMRDNMVIDWEAHITEQQQRFHFNPYLSYLISGITIQQKHTQEEGGE